MSQNLQINPQTRDYVFENGSPVESNRILEDTYFALTIPQNNHVYAEEGQGSLLYTLKNMKRTSSIEQTFMSYVKDATDRQLIKTGKATQVRTSNLQTTPTGTNNQIDVVPSETYLSNQYDFTPV